MQIGPAMTTFVAIMFVSFVFPKNLSCVVRISIAHFNLTVFFSQWLKTEIQGLLSVSDWPSLSLLSFVI